jgi:sugar-specific transcriptional regulator TrmB
MEELIRELVHLGLSDKEAAVYLASLELGPAVVQDIAHKAKVNRATTYVMIEALTGRGLMSMFVKGKKRFYVPETPERLLAILRMQRSELEEKESEFQKTLPMLLALFNVEGAKPQIRYLEGPDGLETVRDIFEHLEGEFVQIVPIDEVDKIHEIVEGRGKHLAELSRRNAAARMLFVTDATDVSSLPPIPSGEIRLVPKTAFPIHGEITVRGNHVFLYSYKSAVLSVVIISKEIADTIRALFDLAWNAVPPLVKK